MKVLTYNVHGWRTPDGEPNVDLVASAIAVSDADLVGLNEVFHPAGRNRIPLAELAKRLGMSYVFGYTLSATESRGGIPYGNACLSRWPILAYAAHRLPSVPDAERRGMLEVRVSLSSTHLFTLYVTHLDHRSEVARLAQWAAAVTWLARDRNRPHLLLGDFNALSAADYPTSDAIAHLAASNAARVWLPPAFDLVACVLKADYVDAFARAGQGEAPTWPSDRPERRIDYIFVPEVLASVLVSCRRWEHPLAVQASDHLPVLAELEV